MTSKQFPGSGGGADFAWKVHSALQDWTARVDTKASIVMTLETALLGVALAFSGAVGGPTQLGAPGRWTRYPGLLLLVLSIVLAGAVVFPQLGRRTVRSERHQLVYFGHLRHSDPAELARSLGDPPPDHGLRALSDQMVTMSRILWRKYIILRWSMVCALAGCAATGISLAVSAPG